MINYESLLSEVEWTNCSNKRRIRITQCSDKWSSTVATIMVENRIGKSLAKSYYKIIGLMTLRIQ